MFSHEQFIEEKDINQSYELTLLNLLKIDNYVIHIQATTGFVLFICNEGNEYNSF